MSRSLLVNVSIAEIHREPSHESEITTQARLGERLTVTGTAGGGKWIRVLLSDGYRGWVRSWLTAPDTRAWPGSRFIDVAAPFTWVRAERRDDAEPVTDVTIGTRLPAVGRAANGWIRVRLPDGRDGELSTETILRGRPLTPRSPGRPMRTDAALATARRFLGVPYVWGGKSPKGFDCSGFVQLVHELHGVIIPRDSRDQRRWLMRRGRAIRDPLAVPEGGLLFFGAHPRRASHVGFSLGLGGLLHAQGWVRIQSLDPHNPQCNKELGAIFQVGFPPLFSRR